MSVFWTEARICSPWKTVELDVGMLEYLNCVYTSCCTFSIVICKVSKKARAISRTYFPSQGVLMKTKSIEIIHDNLIVRIWIKLTVCTFLCMANNELCLFCKKDNDLFGHLQVASNSHRQKWQAGHSNFKNEIPCSMIWILYSVFNRFTHERINTNERNLFRTLFELLLRLSALNFF